MIKTSIISPKSPSSNVAARNRLAPPLDHFSPLVRVLVCSVITLRCDHKDSPSGGDQTDDQEAFCDQNVRVDGDPHPVQNLDQHQHDEQLIEYQPGLEGDGPMDQTFRRAICRRPRDGCQCGDKEQHGKNPSRRPPRLGRVSRQNGGAAFLLMGRG